MPQNVKCPGCKARLRYTRDLDGEPGVCPECEHLILPPEGKSKDEADNTLRAVKPLDSRMDDLRSEGQALAKDNDIRLRGILTPNYGDKAQVNARIQELKVDLPVTESAYQPSGKLPVSALGSMLLGAGVAIIAALLAELVGGAAAAAIIAIMAAINLAIACVGFIVYIAVIAGVIIGVLALALPFIAGGWTAARVTTYFGQLGKNRNETVASVLSIAATAVSIVILWVAYYFVGERLIEMLKIEVLSDATLQWIGHGVMGVGGLLAMLVSLGAASSYVKDAKFCEECEEFMEETELRTLGVGAVHGMVVALKERRPEVAAGLLCCDPGDDGKVTLFHCPTCDAGYVEISLMFKAKYTENASEQTREETWRVASESLDEYEVEWFRIFKDEAGDDRFEE